LEGSTSQSRPVGAGFVLSAQNGDLNAPLPRAVELREIDSLPLTQCQPAVAHRYRLRCPDQRCLDVRRGVALGVPIAVLPRHQPVGNGALLINFDRNYQLRDIYYPRVGQENHTSGELNRFGIWVDGRFAWLDDHGWSRDLVYLPDTLVTNVTLRHPDLALSLTFNDAVDLG